MGDHIKTRGSGGPCHPDNMWSLCFAHHREKEDNPFDDFVERYPKLKRVLLDKGWIYDEHSYKRKWYIPKDKQWL